MKNLKYFFITGLYALSGWSQTQEFDTLLNTGTQVKCYKFNMAFDPAQDQAKSYNEILRRAYEQIKPRKLTVTSLDSEGVVRCMALKLEN